MKVAFLHYHLRPGGVTTVIKQQIEAIRENCETLVITGEPPNTPWPADIAHIPGIAYNGKNNIDISPDAVAEAIDRAIFAKWKTGCDLIHIHNPLLKKNRHFLNILEALQKKKRTLFLQVHDFAEDGRPGSYFSEPYITDCHYGVINSRDYHILRNAGLRTEGLHKIYNTVKPIFTDAAVPLTRRIIYPIRAIRRKNLGEAILIALFSPDNAELGITLPPNSPVDMRAYDDWKRFSAANRLPVAFDLGLKHDFSELIASSRFLVSTSIGEGFGFSFLEPWTAGKLLWGRDLPEITQDFEKLGIDLDHLYAGLNIPLSGSQKSRLWALWEACIITNCKRYGLPSTREKPESVFEDLTKNNHVDFGLLNEYLQKEIILKILHDKRFKASVLEANPFLAAPGRIPDGELRIEKNKTVIKDRFSESVYREHLLQIYEKVCTAPVVHSIDKGTLLASFFNLRNLSLLKWGDYAV